MAQTQTVESNIVEQLKALPQGPGLFRLVSVRHGFPVAFYQLLNPPADEAPSTSFAVEGSSPAWLSDGSEPAKRIGLRRNSGRWVAGAAVVKACIDGRKQPQGGPVEVRPTAGHHGHEAVMDEGRGGHRHGRAFGLG